MDCITYIRCGMLCVVCWSGFSVSLRYGNGPRIELEVILKILKTRKYEKTVYYLQSLQIVNIDVTSKCLEKFSPST